MNLELEVKGNKFYMLVRKESKGKEIWLYNDAKTPISKIKEYLKKGANADDIELINIELKEEKFEIRTTLWSTIAVELIKET
jgi:hypothetical protein